MGMKQKIWPVGMVVSMMLSMFKLKPWKWDDTVSQWLIFQVASTNKLTTLVMSPGALQQLRRSRRSMGNLHHARGRGGWATVESETVSLQKMDTFGIFSQFAMTNGWTWWSSPYIDDLMVSKIVIFNSHDELPEGNQQELECKTSIVGIEWGYHGRCNNKCLIPSGVTWRAAGKSLY